MARTGSGFAEWSLGSGSAVPGSVDVVLSCGMSLRFQDYYETLGVSRHASVAEIQRAYRQLARKHHPDVNKGQATDDKFKKISEAYEVLKDPEKRQKYDTLGRDWKDGQQFQPPPGFDSIRFDIHGPRAFAGDKDSFSEFFETFFRDHNGGSAFGMGDGQASPQHHRRRKGNKIESTITISLDEAYHGTTRQVTLKDARTGTRRKLDVKIPAGTTAGAKIRLVGQGGAGGGGGPAGDLILEVQIGAHPQFQVRGHNLHHRLAITPWEAVLGAKVAVPTLEGQVTLTIPAGAAGGQKLRLRGKGLPLGKGSEDRGDLLVILDIQVPKQLSDEERELFEKLAQISGFDPRAGSSGP